MTFQRIVQICCLSLFLFLLWLAAFPLEPEVPVDAFLRMDPLATVGTALAARAIIAGLWVAVALLILTAVMGRFFCGTLCPMGTTIDMTDRLTNLWNRGQKTTRAKKELATNAVFSSRWRPVKFYLLAFIMAAALFGVSLVFLASPLSLITRFYGMVVFPILAIIAEAGLTIVRPLANRLDLTSIAYAQIDLARFAWQWLTVATFAAIFALARYAPRFWCRYLCPAGGFFALAATRPIVRRKVSDACIDCGQCQRDCPMHAIPTGPNEPRRTIHGECIVCQTCVRICPVDAISFGPAPLRSGEPNAETVSVQRRRVLASGVFGAGTALATMTGLHYRQNDETPGQVLHPALIRPPGAIPERSFLQRCIRCGECMKACPTNTLQPIGFFAGPEAFFSPRITPQRGPCEPACSACGQVCPTGAIRPLPLEEKLWAKVGTAQVLRHKCLAWEFDRKCLVCDEVCPYDAIDLAAVPGQAVEVPFVQEHRCTGCGFCEYHCPVGARPAIVVEPMEAMRLADGSYAVRGREIGLDIRLNEGAEASAPYPDAAPDDGYSLEETENGGLPPGFTE